MKVYTIFNNEPLDVPEDEAALLQRQGLLRAVQAPLDTPAPPGKVKVTPVFTGVEIEVEADEAESLTRQGLLVQAPAAVSAPAIVADVPQEEKEQDA